MKLLRNRGLELPVFPPETPVAWHTFDIARAARLGDPDFVRRATLKYDGPGNLKRALGVADTAIKALVDFCELVPLEYSWGLYKGHIPYDSDYHAVYDSSLHGLVPRGYSLVAEVASIANARPLNPQEADFIHIRTHSYAYRQGHDGTLIELRTDQFVAGNTDEETRNIWHVDLDPRMRI